MYRELLYQHQTYPIKVKFIDSTSLELVAKQNPALKNWCDNKLSPLYGSTIDSFISIKGQDWKCIYVVVNMKKGLPKIGISTIVHEIIHVKNFIFDHIGHNTSLENDEPEAYLVGELTKVANLFYKP